MKWRFNPGDRVGINDSGIETFKGQIINSLGREICQNSLDAKLIESERVRVEFKEFKLERDQFPGIDGLIDAFERALKFWGQERNTVKSAVDFFNNGLDILKRDEISVLRISDFNTTGLVKSKEHFSSPWFNLVTASGVSQKSGSAGGSFGIGKSAPFACTDIRTVFYSTLDEDGIEASQGVCRIATFEDKNGNETAGKGYYGVRDDKFPNKNAPTYEQLCLDPQFKREESGTDIYIMGFKEWGNWKDEIIKSLLNDFLISIYEDKLEVIVDDAIINRRTLENVLNSFYAKYEKDLRKTYNYYQLLISDKTRTFEYEIKDLGKIEFKVLLGADVPELGLDLHRQALITRTNGMKLFDRGYISGSIPFVGVLKLTDDRVSSFFRLLEPPEHNAWEADRYEGKKGKTYAKRKIDEVNRFMSKKVNEIGHIPISAEMDAIGVGDYLPDDFLLAVGNTRMKESILDKSKSIEIVEIKEPDKVKNRPGKGTKEEERYVYGIFDENGDLIGGNPSGAANETDGGQGKDGRYTESLEADTKVKKLVSVIPRKERCILVDKAKNKYKMVLELDRNIKCGYLKFQIKREQGREIALISSIGNRPGIQYRIEEDKIYFSSEKEIDKIETVFQLEYDEPCSLEVEAYGSEL